MAQRCSHCGRTQKQHNGPDGKYRACLVLYRKPESVSEQMQGELEPLPAPKKWDGDSIGEVLKHGRE